MVTAEQARGRIWASIVARGGAALVSEATREPSGGGEVIVSVSMLYKFKSGERFLGRETVNAIASVLTDIDHETWLAAMGVESAAAVA